MGFFGANSVDSLWTWPLLRGVTAHSQHVVDAAPECRLEDDPARSAAVLLAR